MADEVDMFTVGFTITSVTNPRWARPDNSMLVVTAEFVETADLGPLDFATYNEADTPHGQEVWDRVISGEFGPIAPYEEPEPLVPTSVSRWQLIEGLATVGWITEQEALDAMATGARPATVEAVISSLPEDEQFKARMKWISFQNALRDDPLVNALAQIQGKTDDEIDEFFKFCDALEV